jgi:hypothetical protein
MKYRPNHWKSTFLWGIDGSTLCNVLCKLQNWKIRSKYRYGHCIMTIQIIINQQYPVTKLANLHLLTGHYHKKVCQKSILGDALGLKYEPLTCSKFFRSSLKKLWILKKFFEKILKKKFCSLPPTVNYIWPEPESLKFW